ncbi:MAG: M48 family metallopeptidase, partial [Rhodocyclaceae bacterium]|nr:M48 family metallopeptidase [Rhodocyclaceae bacterium]
MLTVRAIGALGVLSLAWMACAAITLALLSAAWNGGFTLIAALQWAGALLAGLQAVRIGRWLAAPPPSPEGVPLARDQAPSLYRLADRLAQRAGAPAVDAIHITPDISAAVYQRPRWAWAGPMRTTLLIGLPLVHSVSARQLGAIVAHEMGHLARQRRGAGAWGAHLRAWWHRVCERIAADGSPAARLLHGAFEDWAEADLMDAVSLSHLEEYEADRVAARVVGAALLGDALVEVAMKARFIETDYWHKVMAQAAHLPRPRIRPFRDMGMGVAAGFNEQQRSGVLRSIVLSETGQSLHPALA